MRWSVRLKKPSRGRARRDQEDDDRTDALDLLPRPVKLAMSETADPVTDRGACVLLRVEYTERREGDRRRGTRW